MKAYIYGLFDGDEQIDQTSLDEMNENLAYEIMVKEEGRIDCKHLAVSFLGETEEEDDIEYYCENCGTTTADEKLNCFGCGAWLGAEE